MKTVHHPTHRNITYNVPDKSVPEWEKAGWLKTPPKPTGSPVVDEHPNEVDPERTPA